LGKKITRACKAKKSPKIYARFGGRVRELPSGWSFAFGKSPDSLSGKSPDPPACPKAEKIKI
jgi:hypothetical protein